MPWETLFRWRINGLMIGPKKEVKDFPAVKPNCLIVFFLILIGLILFLSLGLLFKDRIEKIELPDLSLIKGLYTARVSTSPQPGKSAQETEKPTAQPDTPEVEPRSITQTLANEDLPLELKRINNLISLDDQNADAFYNRGWIYEYRGEFEKAVEDYTRAIDIDKAHADAYYNRGLIYIRQGKYTLAITDFTQVIKQKGEDADVFNNRGNAYMQLNKYESALNDYNTAIRISPNDPDSYYNRGIVYRSKGEYGKSRQDFQKAAEMGHKQARELLGLPPIKK